MKILIVGSDKVFSIENFYLKHLKSLGVDVERFTAQSIFYDYYYNASILKKILFKLGLSSIYKQINNQFKIVVTNFNPKIIWVFKGMEITPKSLKWAKEKGIKLVNYNPDNPFIFTGKGSGNANVTNSIELYDFHFTYNLAVKKQLEEKFMAKTDFLPFGYEMDNKSLNLYIKEKEIIKVCFLGNPDKIRAKFINSLAINGVSIDVFGNNWKNFLNHNNITAYAPVYGDDQWRVLRKYRIQLNLMRIHNINSHNMRTFEIAGVGGIQLAPCTFEHQLFFEDGKEIFLYKNLKECLQQIHFLLNLTPQKALEFRNYAQKAAEEKKHQYKNRAEQAYNKLKLL